MRRGVSRQAEATSSRDIEGVMLAACFVPRANAVQICLRSTLLVYGAVVVVEMQRGELHSDNSRRIHVHIISYLPSPWASLTYEVQHNCT